MTDIQQVIAIPFDELPNVAAIEVMGWERDEDEEGFWGWSGEGCNYWGTRADGWQPHTDRNQSRVLMDRVRSLAPGKPVMAIIPSQCSAEFWWTEMTAEDETRAAILAERRRKNG